MKQQANTNDLELWEPKPNQSRDYIITWLYSRSDLMTIIRKFTDSHYLAEELKSELFLYLCKKEHDEIVDYYQRKVIDFVIIHFLDRQVHSNNTRFHKIRRGAFPKELIEKAYSILYPDTNGEIKDTYELALQDAIDKLRSPGQMKDFHKKIMLEFLKQDYSIKNTAKKLKIRPEYISHAIKDAKIMLEPLISKEVNNYLNNKIPYVNELSRPGNNNDARRIEE